VLGLDFGGSKIAAGVADLSGRRLGTSIVETEPTLGARHNLEGGVGAAKALLADVAAECELVAVGACTFGIPATYEIRLAPAIPGWGELSLGLELAAAFGTRVVRVDTDVKAAARAEAAAGALAGHDPALYVNLGTGLAIAIVAGGEVIAGAHGASGEVGYNLRQPGDVDTARADRLVLEEAVSGMGLSAAAFRVTGQELTAADVFAAEGEDTRLSAVLAGFVRELCFHMVNLAVAVDPSRIAVGGGMVRSWHRLEGPLRAALDANVPYAPELVLGAYPFDAALVGAIALGIEAARGHQGNGKQEDAGGALQYEPARQTRTVDGDTDDETIERSEDRRSVWQ
jgi:glucokinase